ncbi:MAG: MBL fold metallo-hydrolase [Clostridia bacterium]|nr:MBL fold metallo-hydrolase [Clostridia bacterium]MBR5015976.1 MBL fold metallo-hydrolase [Clostridia bacterium]MBR5976652.1 MBL fold metallo-hydrolase [Clostridia bacterium]MBR6479424.1 MBL fold metallo-hydrolase [Clostridia bacterium]MBR6511995.1 MBL fold metallo-hydrolase [Clostridia bacterium]
MKVSKVVLGPVDTNCYIVLEEQSGLGAVIDPSVYTTELLDAIEASGMTKLQYIILTHGHSDHILGVYDLKKKYPDATVVIGDDDEICLMSAACSLAADLGLEQQPMHADKVVKDGDTFFFGPIEVKAVSTPGHTPGSICYLFDNIMFSGDTLFCRTCGRTDLFRGNLADMHESIQKLGKLAGDFIVYPGHGPSTTLDSERKTNRFMRKIEWSLL